MSSRPTRSTGLTRRDWLTLSAAGVVGYSMSGWLQALADDTAAHPQRRRSCILLWMNGGPSQIDTFDPKPGHANGGPFRPIATSVPGVRLCEHLPLVAKQTDHLAIINSVGGSVNTNDHHAGYYYQLTGHVPDQTFLTRRFHEEFARYAGGADGSGARENTPSQGEPRSFAPDEAPGRPLA